MPHALTRRMRGGAVWKKASRLALLGLFLGGAASAFPEPGPSGIDLAEMRSLQAKVQAVSVSGVAATVHVRTFSNRASIVGSGVIINEAGLILTAAHVIGEPGRRCQITLHDGRRLEGETLGLNLELDCGMIRILDRDETFDFAPVADERRLEIGSWCVATGHPGGLIPGRPPVVRLGRLQEARGMAPFMLTDCAIISGDSGGPLFNLDGDVIGIHSRIQARVSSNYHVGGSTFLRYWDRMLSGQKWQRARLGVRVEDASPGARIQWVGEQTSAGRSGLMVGDVILRLDGRSLRGRRDLYGEIDRKEMGQQISVVLRRGDERIEMDIALGGASRRLP